VAQVMPATPITEPTDRSMPPVSSTKVSPTAQMPMIDTCRSTLRRFAPVRKTSLLAVKTSTRSAGEVDAVLRQPRQQPAPPPGS
jgi:hypothetical protein